MTLPEQLATLLFIAWLPGAVLFRLPYLERDRRAALDPEERAFWAIVLSLAVSLSLVLALAAAGRYSLPRVVVVNAGLILVAVAIWRGRLRLRPPRRASLGALAAVALAVFCYARFSPGA